MDDHLFYSFLQSLKDKKTRRKGVSIKPINFENYKITLKGKGVMELSDLAALYEWSKNTLRQSAHQIDFLCTYHPDSPRFWMKNIEKKYERDEGKTSYNVNINLEEFIESSYKKKQKKRIEAVGSYIPDNYELARKVMDEFRKANPQNKKYKFEDDAFRECANWYCEDLNGAKALANYIQKKYVEPSLKHVFKINNIKECRFANKQIHFIYK